MLFTSAMKFLTSVTLISSLIGLGLAQTATSDVSGCVSKCDTNDISCKAQCLGITFPTGDSAAEVQKCVGQCDGSNPNLPACLRSCVSSNGSSPGTDGVKGADGTAAHRATNTISPTATSLDPAAASSNSNVIASATSAVQSIYSSASHAVSSVASSVDARATSVRAAGSQLSSNPVVYGMLGVLAYNLQH
ncbi:hypothetical protein K493DRAFT_378965 [Basidiobolus meristosporus CBS 931.73]|uniref:Extracellular membrane protein CFEM domain-containing protein n=1 Tax=Basidiobolus meristosporus CBS 931.73 TaxID=1314790 RepID=A0A1Y1XZY5_9FUNG|nr:hypothetical protein K493DRAFT_378965 [Basidiobolus meristosporus CBS 931.73]|eukprot:ORX91301.1 hypothetical protein K493DRAFT_378965 [Basidiobolus meristosporus CBS 931.73]